MSNVSLIAPAHAPTSALGRQAIHAGVFLTGHAMLGLLVRASPPAALLHSITCLILGVFIAITRPRRQVAHAVVYVAAAEVLWRMGHGTLFHEHGKYAVVVLLGISLLRFPPRRNRALAIGYIALLLPSGYLTLSVLNLDEARQQVSFNLSGPLSLTLCVLFFSQLKTTPDQLRRMFFIALGPILSIATFAAFSTFSVQNIEFVNTSNFATSGGFGPNQVSAALGLGVLLALLLVFERKMRWRPQVVLIAIAAFLAIQAALTFSRGGLGMAVASLFIVLLYLIRDRRSRITLFVVATTFATVGYYIVYPNLETFTKGKMTERYTSSDSSNRLSLAAYDLAIFEDNPVLGVGPGMATESRGQLGIRAIAHTEFTRMLSEHGVLGAVALLLLIMLGFRTMRSSHHLIAKALVAALLAWVVLFLLINAMRLVAPSVVFGLACMIAYSSKTWSPYSSKTWSPRS